MLAVRNKLCCDVSKDVCSLLVVVVVVCPLVNDDVTVCGAVHVCSRYFLLYVLS